MEHIKQRLQYIKTENDLYQILLSIKTNRKKRNHFGEFIVEGTESIKQAVSAEWTVRRFLFTDYYKLSRWAKDLIAVTPQAETLQLKPELYAALGDKNTPGELMITCKTERPALDELVTGDCPFILILDRPSNPGNLGSILRSANAFGVDAVVISGHGVDPYDPKTVRSSLGAVFHVPVVQTDSHDELEAWLKTLTAETGMTVYGTDSAGDTPLGRQTMQLPAAVIIGNEAKGISVRLQGLCRNIISIPLTGEVNSLNAACAASILLWEFQRPGSEN